MRRRLTMLALLAAPVALPAQGRTAAAFLGQPASARAAAMGDAGTATAGGDAASLLYNPAALATVPRAGAALSVERYVAGSTLGALALAGRVRGIRVGAAATTLDYPEVAELVPSGDGTGIATGRTVAAGDLAAGVAVAAGGRHGRAGVLAKWVAQSLPGAGGGTLAADAGVARDLPARPWGRATVAAAVQHLGSSLASGSTRAPLPRAWRAGLALADVPLAGGRWQAAADLVGVRDGRVAPRGGVEGAWRTGGAAVAARAGWAAQEGGALARPLTLGAGLAARGVWVDYAWRQFETLGGTHRVGVRWERR